LNIVQIICLDSATIGFGLAMFTFLLMAPWYKSLAGVILFSVKLCFFLMLFYFWYRVNYPSQLWIRGLLYFLYPSTAIVGFALTWVIARAQYTGVHRRHKNLEQQLFSKHPTQDAWTGPDRRSPNSPPEEQ
jgi:chromate transport protein ChrA